MVSLPSGLVELGSVGAADTVADALDKNGFACDRLSRAIPFFASVVVVVLVDVVVIVDDAAAISVSVGVLPALGRCDGAFPRFCEDATRSAVIFRKSSSRSGQMAFVGCVMKIGPSYPHISVK